MNKFVKSLFLFCVFITTTNPSFSEEDVVQTHVPERERNQIDVNDSSMNKLLIENQDLTEGRSIADAAISNDHFEKHSKPLRSIFLGIYKNYKSTYMGNKTLTEYKQTLRENIKNRQQQQQQQEEQHRVPDEDVEVDDAVTITDYPATQEDEEEVVEVTTTTAPQPPVKQEPKVQLSPNKKRKLNVTQFKTIKHQYNVGPALNLSLDMDNSIVKVNLDGESLRELVTGRWLNDNTEEGLQTKFIH